MSVRALVICGMVVLWLIVMMLMGRTSEESQPVGSGMYVVTRLNSADGSKYMHPISIQVGRIVIFEPADRSTLEQKGVAFLRDCESGVEFSVAGVTDTIEFEKRVRSLAANHVGKFISPIFRDESNLDFFFAPQLIVCFEQDISERGAMKILKDFNAGSVLQTNYAGMQNVYLVSSPAQNGFALLRLANAIAQHPHVSFAEPNTISRVQLR